LRVGLARMAVGGFFGDSLLGRGNSVAESTVVGRALSMTATVVGGLGPRRTLFLIGSSFAPFLAWPLADGNWASKGFWGEYIFSGPSAFEGTAGATTVGWVSEGMCSHIGMTFRVTEVLRDGGLNEFFSSTEPWEGEGEDGGEMGRGRGGIGRLARADKLLADVLDARVVGGREEDRDRSSEPPILRDFPEFPIVSFETILCSRPEPLDLLVSRDAALSVVTGGPSARKSIISRPALDTGGAVGGPSAKKSIKSRVLEDTAYCPLRLGVVGVFNWT